MERNSPRRNRSAAFVAAAALVLAAALPAAEPRPAASRPNIVVILVDDMGYSDIGCYGAEIETPHLDGLAARGLRFSQFYTTPKCFPSRASLLTGLYPHQTGLGKQPLKLENCTTVAETLRAAGYHTWMVGKWHGQDNPAHRGFDRFFGLLGGACNHFNPGRQRPGEPVPATGPGRRNWGIDGETLELYTPEDPKFYSTDAYTDHALRYIDEQKDERPFFLHIAYTAPHFPIQAWPEDIAKYRGRYRQGWDAIRRARFERQREMGLLPPGTALAPRGNTALADVRATGPWMSRFWDDAGNILPWEEVADHERWDLKMAVYAAMVDRIDWNVGRLLDRLRALGKLDNTLVMFLSDNGASAGTHHAGATRADPPPSGPGPMDSFHTYDTPWADVSGTPLFGYKDTCYEGGIATPLVVSWPAGLKTPPGHITHAVGHIMDIVPTCLELAGAAHPATFGGQSVPPLEGRSLAPIFRGGPRPGHEYLFWEYNGDRAVRHGDWKLLSLPGQPWQLYDLATDRAEQRNLAADQPGLVRALDARWREWAARVGAPGAKGAPAGQH